jgi:hypothetical protein
MRSSDITPKFYPCVFIKTAKSELLPCFEHVCEVLLSSVDTEGLKSFCGLKALLRHGFEVVSIFCTKRA